MADLDGLKKRVEQVDLRLKTAHRAREMESAALMDIWEQIRGRFDDQNAEINELRARVAELEDEKDDLLHMVHGLLGAVEGGLERISDETVPRIKVMAGDLLNADAAPAHTPPPVAEARVDETDEIIDDRTEPSDQLADPVGGSNFHDDLLSAIERSIESAAQSAPPDTRIRANDTTKRVARQPDEPASPGIRDLVWRIENAMGQDLLDEPVDAEDVDDEDEDELSRDLREIEALRGELDGLRQRISSGR